MSRYILYDPAEDVKQDQATEDKFVFIGYRPHNGRSKGDNIQIRSHCMKGKNRRPDSLRSKREARRASLSASQQWNTTQTEATEESGFANSLQLLRHRNWFSQTMQSLPSLVQVDPIFFQIARNTLKSPRELLTELALFLRVTERTTMFDELIDYNEPYSRPNLPPLDDAIIQGILLINSVAYDQGQRRPFAEKSALITAKTLNLLNKKLDTREAFLEASTIYTISFLAAAAGATGDLVALNAHMKGLHRIVSLKGGAQCLGSLMQYKIGTLDMVLALSLGSKPYFLTGPQPVEDPSLIYAPTLLDPYLILGPSYVRLVDARVKVLFQELENLTILLNRYFNAKQKVDARVYYPAIRLVSTGLLRIECALNAPADICICLGMLCFILSIFQMPSQLPTYTYTIGRLRCAIRDIRNLQGDIPQGLIQWCLVMSAISMFDPMDPWLHTVWTETQEPGVSWAKVRQQLKQVLWIDTIHDNLGKAAFTVLTTESVKK